MKIHIKNIYFILTALTLIVLYSCSGDVTDQISNVVSSVDPYVLSVKGGSPNAYPNKTYGEAFDNFFSQPTWKYFKGEKEGPDEDGDGQPDYTEDNVDIVEFTGYCNYMDTEVKARIQFTLSKDDNTFETTYLAFNDVPQSNLILFALMAKAFEDEEDDDNISESSTATSESTAVTEKADPTPQPEYPETPKKQTYKDKKLAEIEEIEEYDYSIDYLDLSSGEMFEAKNESLERYDALLNEIYQYLKANLPENEFKAIQADERVWAKDKMAMEELAQSFESRADRYEALSNTVNMVQKRCYVLIDYIP